ncbi:MAG: hypothetical protein HRT71_15850 [Flavobacteriales bacterium]|nr:hypothetical protein [Flavobacteriales bacterium]
MNKLLAIIPARKGSQRLPNKNFINFHGLPLYARAINQALALPFVSKVVLTTDAESDSLEIPSQVILDARPPHLAKNETLSNAVAIDVWEKHGNNCDGMIWLQPTSPLRTIQHFTDAFEQWDKTGSLVGCTAGNGNHERNVLNGILNKSGSGETVNLNGAIFFTDPDTLYKEDWSDGAQAFYMEKTASVDIDTQDDWDLALELFEA